MKRAFVLLLTVGMLFVCSCSSEPEQTQADLELTTDTVDTLQDETIAPATTVASTDAPVTQPPQTVAPVTTVAPVVNDKNVSPLTGLPIAENLVHSRPIAVMVNNHKSSMPQLGISKADIIYECIAEGGITRLMALFLDYSSVGTIGSVRSSRDYFLDLAQIHDAIYIHAGGSELAYSQMNSRRIDHLDGVRTTVSGVFWRDPDRLKIMSKEHTMVASGETITKGIQKKKFRTEYKDTFQSSYSFYRSVTPLNGNKASYVKVPNSSSYVAEFYYDEDSGLYKKNQFGKAHVDATTGEQLAFTNVIILYAKQKTIDDYGRYEITLTGTGKGYYCSGGTYIPITWSRSDRDGGISLWREDGSPCQLNPGKSYISVAFDSIYNKTVIE